MLSAGKNYLFTLLSVGLFATLAASAPACFQDSVASVIWPPVEPLQPDLYPQYRLEPAHRGISPPDTSVGPGLRLKWKSPALGIGDYTASKSSPAVDAQMVYVGADDGQLYALDRESGSVAWSYRTHRYQVERNETVSTHYGIHGSPAFDARYVYIGDYSGYLYAIEKDSGRLKWETKLGGSIGASPVLYNGYIFISVEYPEPEGKVFVVKTGNGSVFYSTPYLGHHPHASVSIDASRGYLFIGANNGAFYCFDFVGREQVWKYQTGAEIKSTAAVASDVVYATSWDRGLHAIGIDDGFRKFVFYAGDNSMSSPAYYKGKVYFGSDDGYIYCIDAKSGKMIWSFQTGGALVSSPAVVQSTGVVLVGSRDHRLYMLDAQDGALGWSYDLGADISSVPVAVDDRLFVNDDTGTVWCFADS